MRHPILILICALVVALVIAGCGSGGGDSGEPNGPSVGAERSSGSTQNETIAVADADRVLEAEDSINTRCRLTENQEGSDMPIGEAIQIMAEVYRQNPEGLFNAGVTTTSRNMETVVEDNVRKLRDCGATAEADRLAGVLES
jgi:hypothetical protein